MKTGHKNTTESKKEQDSTINPLLCNTETGACEVPGVTMEAAEIIVPAATKPVRIIYFTDPICSTCWGIEPQLRRLKLEYPDYIEIEYYMGGLLPSWDIYNSGAISKPSDVAHHWDEVSLLYDMPIDGDVWIEDPLPSSYPPSIAFKAAQLQDHDKALLFLRRIREMVFLEKKNITKWEYLLQAADEVKLDLLKFEADYEKVAPALFQNDLAYAKQMGVRGFPTFFFTDTLHNQQYIYGYKPYEVYEQALLKLCPDAVKRNIDPDYANVFAHYPTLTTKEFSVLTGIDTKEAATLLEDLYKNKKLEKHTSKNGVMWKIIY